LVYPLSLLFPEVVQKPLERVLGTPLISVAYDVLACDLADFDTHAPNDSGGCQTVRLTFGGGTLALEWDWRETAFRDDATAFYLTLRVHPERDTDRPSTMPPDAEVVVRIAATDAMPWRNLAREVLKQVTVWGWTLANGNESPQAVSFLFPSGAVTVGIGYSPRTVVGWGIGDGDELLVLDESEWNQQLQNQAEGSRLTPLRRLPEARITG
jgi:hypothetical protein